MLHSKLAAAEPTTYVSKFGLVFSAGMQLASCPLQAIPRGVKMEPIAQAHRHTSIIPVANYPEPPPSPTPMKIPWELYSAVQDRDKVSDCSNRAIQSQSS